MTFKVLWNRYAKFCRDSNLKIYSYRQFCENYTKWCKENKESRRFNAFISQKTRAYFSEKAFHLVDHLTGGQLQIMVFVAIPLYSQYIYAVGTFSTEDSHWIVVTTMF